MQSRKILTGLVCFCIGVVAFPRSNFADTPPSIPTSAPPPMTPMTPMTPSEVVSKSLQYVVSEGKDWIEKRGCVSCHQVPSMLWSLSLARSHGYELPSADLTNLTEWSTDPINFVQPNQKENVDVEATLAANIDTMSALLLALESGSDEPWKDTFVQKLCDEQADDGSWKACGQLPLQKRSKEETTAATTLWSTLALLRNGATDFDRQAAIAFADKVTSAESTEWYAARLLVAAESKTFESKTSEQEKIEVETIEIVPFRDQLLKHQNEDGGWGWIVGQPSDALATGMALYALSPFHEHSTDSIDRARTFLVRTQLESGKWNVPGTKSASKDKFTGTSNDWGTAWAVIGLVSTESR